MVLRLQICVNFFFSSCKQYKLMDISKVTYHAYKLQCIFFLANLSSVCFIFKNSTTFGKKTCMCLKYFLKLLSSSWIPFLIPCFCQIFVMMLFSFLWLRLSLEILLPLPRLPLLLNILILIRLVKHFYHLDILENKKYWIKEFLKRTFFPEFTKKYSKPVLVGMWIRKLSANFILI